MFYTRDIKKNNLISEENFGYLSFNGKNIYVSIYKPKNNCKKIIVLLDSLLNEQNHSLYFCSHLARSLAIRGFMIIRFDYYGTGNSDGDFNMVTFDTLCEDFNSIISWSKKNYSDCIFYTCIGIRYGCHILFHYPEFLKFFSKFVFVHPIINMSQYFKSAYIHKHVMSYNLNSEEKLTTKKILESINFNSSIELRGFLFNSLFIKQLLSIKELSTVNFFDLNALFIFDKKYNNSINQENKENNKIAIECLEIAQGKSWDKENFIQEKDLQFRIIKLINNYIAMDYF